MTATTVNITIADNTANLAIIPNKTEVIVGDLINLTVQAKDLSNNINPYYLGTVTFTSSAASTDVVLPSDYQFVSGDAGAKDFNDTLKFTQAGVYTVTVTDISISTLTATTQTIKVNPVNPCSVNPDAVECQIDVVISNVTTEAVDSTTEKVCWDTNINTIGSIQYGKSADAIYTNSTSTEEVYGTSHCQTVNSLAADTGYLFKITSTSNAGKNATYSGAFSTKVGEVITPVEAKSCINQSNDVAFNSQHQAIINYSTATDSICTISYGNSLDHLDFVSSDGIQTTEHQAVIDLQKTNGTDDILYKIECNVTASDNSTLTCNNNGVIAFGSYKDYYQYPQPTGILDNAKNVSQAVPAALIAATAIVNVISYPQLALYAFPWLKNRKRKGTWGIVYDDKTKKPVPFVTVRLFNDAGLVLKQAVTSFDGKYGFFANEGQYRIEAQHSDYNTYFINIKMNEKEIVAENIALTPRQTGDVKKQNRNIIQKLRDNLNKINNFIVIVGLVFSIIATFFSPVLLNFAILAVYVTEFAILFILNRNDRKWGFVYEVGTNKRILGASIRVFDTKEKRQLDVQLTDEGGRFGFNFKEGEYLIKINAPGHILSSQVGNRFQVVESSTGQKLIKIEIKKNKQIDITIPMEVIEESDASKFKFPMS